MSKTITFIGNGNMALGIAKGLKNNYKLEVVGRDLNNLEKFEQDLGVKVDKFLLNGFDVTDKTVILCVKPSNVQEISEHINGRARVIYSVLAGTSLDTLREFLNPHAAIRSMPNLAAGVNKSMTTLTGDKEFQDEAHELLGTIGSTLWLESEKEVNIATGLAGSGPAYLALIAEALADGAVKQGLKRKDALTLMRGLFDGFGDLIQTIHPAILKDDVMSPGGTTAAGYGALEDGNVRAACIKAIEQAYKKAIAL